ncbi:MAG TPA: selenocysteine-specific translation elongation factor [Terriglobales bacterium]|nr:selenocysteine-specific translation elongation factor [Terriglobales bacterium]
MKAIIVGTAGHIDHGKTALVRALTGIDADRLQEEKRRGITIDIGFAHLELPTTNGDALRLGFVDVPGHERFVRNMLAGIGGIDMVLLVIGADEGIKPQTVEHFDICRLLAIPRGITVLTKADLVDEETLNVVRMEVQEFLRGSFLDGAPIVPVSSKTGAGLEELKRQIASVAAEVPTKSAEAIFRLPIDRVFTMKGFGTVVTGTLISGFVTKDDEVEIAPTGKRVRVRGVQVHGQAAEKAVAGERTALNLTGVSTEDLARGMMLTQPGLLRPTSTVDVSIALLKEAKPLKSRARVHLHAYTFETVAEVVLYEGKQLQPGETGFAQLRLAEPTLMVPGDRFILRQFSPVVTIGGGAVLDAAPLARSRVRKEPEAVIERLRAFQKGQPEEVLYARIARMGSEGLSLRDALAETGWHPSVVAATASALLKAPAERKVIRAGELLVAQSAFESAMQSVTAALAAFHDANPLVAGISKKELQERTGLGEGVFAAVVNEVVRQKKVEVAGETVRLAGRGVVMKDEEAEAKQTIESAFAKAGLKVPALKEVIAALPLDKARAQKIVTLLMRDRVLVKLADDLVFHRDALADLRRRLADFKTKSAKIDVTKFKDLTGVSRKYAIPLLEYLDRERVTRRVGDERVIL